MRVAPNGKFLLAVNLHDPREPLHIFLGRVDLPTRSFTFNWIKNDHPGWRQHGSSRLRIYDLGWLRIMVGKYR